jgi:hypothetical protein
MDCWVEFRITNGQFEDLNSHAMAEERTISAYIRHKLVQSGAMRSENVATKNRGRKKTPKWPKTGTGPVGIDGI